jgi:hypothetical protein
MCGEVGVSNASSRSSITFIYKNPLLGIPIESREGAANALKHALNERNRPSKWMKFGFVPSSEDAVTWVVFTYLLRSGRLLKTLEHIGIGLGAAPETVPTLLLWGVPIDGDARGNEIRNRLSALCLSIGEKKRSLSEPDVIIDLAEHGIVFIEVKHRSANDFKKETYRGWKTYFHASALPWQISGVKDSGCYELARNWRILNGLAEGKSATLVNLGRKSLSEGKQGAKLERFAKALGSDDRIRFLKVVWSDFLDAALVDAPTWLTHFCGERGLLAR